MAKEERRRAKADPARASDARPAPRVASPADVSTASPPRRSPAMQLAAEVERLERELSAARAEMATLAARADTDPLTDTLNRRGFERELKRSLAYVKRYGTSAALIYLDLDDFKPINDQHGHAAGDAVLKAVAMVLERHVRASDLVARLGGDEFGVLLWNLDEAAALTKAQGLEVGHRRDHGDVCGAGDLGRRLRRRRHAVAARRCGGGAGARRPRDVCAQGRAQPAANRSGRLTGANPDHRQSRRAHKCRMRNLRSIH